ncbi:MAG: AraC family transcriptional regulator [Gemmatimonadota bacterium]
MSREQPNGSVPVTMGSPDFTTIQAGPFTLTRARFAGGDVLPPHIHGKATFGIMLRGGFDLGFSSGALRKRDYECPAGTIFTEPAGETHDNRIGPKGAEVMVVQIDPSSGHEAVEPFRPLLTDRINHFRHPAISVTARRLAREVRDPDGLSELSGEALALDMLVQAARLRRADARDFPAWLARAEEYVRENFRQPLKIADVAEAAGVHPAHLAAVFRERHDVPLGEFIRRLRIEWSVDRLETTEESISSIAFSAGYADQSHLTRAFKDYMGMPPGAYRRQLD